MPSVWHSLRKTAFTFDGVNYLAASQSAHTLHNLFSTHAFPFSYEKFGCNERATHVLQTMQTEATNCERFIRGNRKRKERNF